MEGTSFPSVISLITFVIIGYVIVKHFLNQSAEKTQRSLDELVEEKKRLLEQTQVFQNPIQPFLEETDPLNREDPEFFQELERKLQWGGENWDQAFSKELQSRGYPVQLKNSQAYLRVLVPTATSKEDFYHSLLVMHLEDLLKNKNTLSFETLGLVEIKFNLMLLLDQSEKLFRYFQGTKDSVLKFQMDPKELGGLDSLVTPELFQKIKSSYQETQSFFLLSEAEVKGFFEASKDPKKIFRELSLHYHPDKIPWRFVPDSQKGRLEKIYSDFYSFIQKVYSSAI